MKFLFRNFVIQIKKALTSAEQNISRNFGLWGSRWKDAEKLGEKQKKTNKVEKKAIDRHMNQRKVEE